MSGARSRRSLPATALAVLALALLALLAPLTAEAAAPGTPDSVTVTRSDGALTASWDAVDGATHYHVTYSSDNGLSWSLAALDHPASGGGTERIEVGGVDNAETYLVGVRAKNGDDGGTWRNSEPAGPYVPPQPPAAVDSVAIARGDGLLKASWDAVDGATMHHVTYSSDNGSSWSLAALEHPSNSITVTGVENSATYIVGVRAGNDGGWSGWVNSPSSGPFVPPTPEPTPTPTPTPAPAPSVTAERGDDGVSASVSWTAYAGDDFSYYRVIVCSDAQYDGASCSGTVHKSAPVYNAASTGPVSVTGLEETSGYGVILQTWRTGGALKSQAALAAVPVGPDNLSVTPGEGYLDIAWDAVSDATGYDVQASIGGSTWVNAASNTASTSMQYTTDDADDIDHVRVRSRNANGSGPWTTKTRGLPSIDWYANGGASANGASANSGASINSGPPVAPASVSATRTTWRYIYAQLNVSWAKVAGADTYNVVCSPNKGWTWLRCGSVSAEQGGSADQKLEVRSYGSNWWERLNAGDPYTVAVQAVDGGQAGAWKSSTEIGGLLGNFLNWQATRADGSITLSWTANPSATEYLVDCAVMGEPYTRCANPTSLDANADRHSVTISSWTDGGNSHSIDNAKTYDVSIASKNQWGTAHWEYAPWVRPYHDGGGADLSVSMVSDTSATLSIKDYSGKYWYKADKGPDSTCRGFDGVDKLLTGLTVGETYIYSAYSAKGCASDKLLATASAYTAGVSVSNLTATSDTIGSQIYSGNPHVTGFTTGGNSGGYTLHSVTVKFLASSGTPGALTVVIAADSNGSPADDPTYTLSGAAPTTAGEYTYTCTKTQTVTCALDASTTYFLSVGGTSFGTAVGYFHADTTASTAETNTPGNAGWSIANAAKVYNARNDNWTDANGWTGIFKVSATPDPSLAASNVATTTATLTIGGYSGAWYYKHTNTGATCDGPVAAGTSTKALTNLTAGTSYTYSAYSDSSCTTGNLLATAAAFTTLATLTSSNVTATGATLTIAGHSGNWYYKHTNTGATCDGPVSETTKNVTGLDAGTSYTFSAYSDSSCTTGNLLATAAAFTTLASLAASNVTVTGATLTIAGHSGNWYYKSTTTGKTTCTSASSASSVTLTGMDANTSYTFSAYSDSTCTTGNLLATAAQFTTLSSVSNLGSTNAGESGISNTKQAVAFTTGSNSGGYTLTSITVPLKKTTGRTGKTVTFTLHAMQGSGQYNANSQASDTALATLTLSGTLPTDRNAYTNTTFTCSGSGCSLQNGKTYFVVVVGDDGSWDNWAWSYATTETETKQPSNNGWDVKYGHSRTPGGLAWSSASDYNLAQIVFATS